MTATFLGLPRELRELIYTFLWCSPGYARLGNNTSKVRTCRSYPERVSCYPPPISSSDGDVDDDEDEDDWDFLRNPGRPEDYNVSSQERHLIDGNFRSTPNGDRGKWEFDPDDWWTSPIVTDFDAERVFADTAKMRRAHKLQLLSEPVNSSLISVNKQIRTEALPAFYANLHFILDGESVDVICFLTFLPRLAQQNVRRITLTTKALGLYYEPPQPCYGTHQHEIWAVSQQQPFVSTENGKRIMFTPFGAVLASKFPKLKHIAFSAELCGIFDPPFMELCMLLRDGPLERLDFVFPRIHCFRDLELGRPPSSKDFYEYFMGRSFPSKMASELFQSTHAVSKYTWKEAERNWKRRFDREIARFKYVKEHKSDFGWDWAPRNIDMGSDGEVEAVISLYKRSEPGKSPSPPANDA